MRLPHLVGVAFISMIGMLGYRPATAEIAVCFSPSEQVPLALEAAIDSAATSIDIAIYSFNDATLRSKLKEAAKRGANVRILLHQAHKAESLSRSLEAAGADVRYVSKVMHHKFLLIDGETLCTGSANWSRSNYSRYDDDLLVMKGEHAFVEAFQREFELLWRNAVDFGHARFEARSMENAPTPNAYFTSSNMTPTLIRGKPSFRTTAELPGSCGSQLISAIQAAKSEIRIATTHFRRFDVHNELLLALQRGVKIRLLLDQQEFDAEEARAPSAVYDAALSKAGAEVLYKVYGRKWDYNTAEQMHAKYMIIDDVKLLTGSLNWSENAELGTFDNLLCMDDPKVVHAYRDQFELKWTYGREAYAALIASLRSSQGQTPCNFSPISLSASQFRELLSKYAASACE